jgi:hypothetical protein
VISAIATPVVRDGICRGKTVRKSYSNRKIDGRGGRSKEMVVEFDDGNPFGRNTALL